MIRKFHIHRNTGVKWNGPWNSSTKDSSEIRNAGKNYTLRRLVHSIAPVNKGSNESNAVGHYVAITLRKNGEWTKHNDLKPANPTRVSNKLTSKPHLLLYSL